MKEKICTICDKKSLIILYDKAFCTNCKLYFDLNHTIMNQHQKSITLCDNCTLPTEKLFFKNFDEFMIYMKKNICSEDLDSNKILLSQFYHENKKVDIKHRVNWVFLLLLLCFYYYKSKLLYLLLLFYFDIKKGFHLLPIIFKLLYYILELDELFILILLYIFEYYKGDRFVVLSFQDEKLEKDLNEISEKIEKIKL